MLESVLCGRRLGKVLANTARSRIGNGVIQVVERGNSLPAAQLAALRELLWQAGGPVREDLALRDALRTCTKLARIGWQATLAKTLLHAMRLRRHSLGAHHRCDRVCVA
ncbi:hypothetical protein [Rhodanobacter sp. 115]|uniref:hypothetical protein n=1 Tax=Rhodanobacter sp. FW021-MT20 TaxID=1162282 RepID=UPI001ED97171|nr:hypothetical protein [Rhodanobacter sp. 115]